MNPADLIAAFDLPRSTRVDQRVAKKLLVEKAAVVPADKRRINDGIEELTWVAALKPNRIGVPAFRDDIRDYREIAVLSLVLRPNANPARLIELVHRAIPYPLLLVASQAELLSLSAAHKRRAQNEPGKAVLEGAVVIAELPSAESSVVELPPLSLSVQPRGNLWILYQGWLECVEAMQAARLTGKCTIVPEAAVVARRNALAEHARLTRELARLRTQAARESQVPRRVELNLEIKRLETALRKAMEML